MGLSLVRSTLTQVSKRGLAVTAARRADQVMPDPVEHATGLEKYELLAKLAGNEDPFFLRAVTRGKGTKENPTIINAMDNYRMVGCVCAEEDTNIKWTWLSEGAPKRCECGFWMELKSHPYSQLRPSHSVRFAEIHKDGICLLCVDVTK